MSKPAFPQTPAGVTDWQKVFEDPDTGLIAIIARAPNVDSLRECLMVVTNQLFTRKDDELEIARVMGEIERLFAHAGGTLPTQDAIDLLRSIKDQRILKAQAYLAAKNARIKDRRAKEPKKKLQRTLYLLFKKPQFLVAATVAMLVLAAGMFIPIEDLVPEPVKPMPKLAELPEKPEISEKQKRNEFAALAERRRQAAKEEYPPTILFRHIAIPKSFSEKRSASGPLVLPVAVLIDRDALRDVCLQAPFIYHSMNVAFSEALAGRSEFTDADLARIAEDTRRELNAKLKNPLVERFMFLRETGRQAYARHDCSLASNSVVRLLEPFKKN